MLLKFKLDKDGFTFTNPADLIAAESIDYIKCHFDITDTVWKETDAIIAVFKSATYNKHSEVLLDSYNNCYIDPEVYKRGGRIQVKLVGDKYLNDTVISSTTITSVLEFNINENIIVPLESPSKYSIAIAELEKAKSSVDEALTDLAYKLAHGELNGVGIDHIVYNLDGTVTITLSDGTVFTSEYSMKGATGNSGVYYGPDEPTDPDIFVWVNPDGEPTFDPLYEIIDTWMQAHPEATTTVQDGAITRVKLSAALQLETIKDYVTPEMFGAVGDGVTDDTIALQNAVNDGFTNKVPVILSAKYLITAPIKIKGISSTYQEKGSQILGNGFAHIIAGAAISNIIETDPAIDTRTYGITIKDLTLDGNNQATNGIYSGFSTSECIFENITINQCTNGLHINGNCYLNNFRAIRLYHCTTYGILFENGNNTSNIFEKCYVDTCANAYKINGQYSSMISCCADNITGIVFYLGSFTGALIGCGSEATQFTTMFYLRTNSNVFVGGGMYFGNKTLSGYYFDIGSGCQLGIYNAIFNYANAQSTGSLCHVGAQAKLTIKNCDKYYGFAGANTIDSTTSRLFDETAVSTMDVAVTLNENNEAVIDLHPARYFIVNVYSTDRSGWRFIPLRTGTSEQVIHVMSSGNWAPSISDKNFTLRINYVDMNVI